MRDGENRISVSYLIKIFFKNFQVEFRKFIGVVELILLGLNSFGLFKMEDDVLELDKDFNNDISDIV